jgi:predicted flap endonuclease-1-like 5' DNA nuclease
VILDFLEVWLTILAAFAGGAFIGALLHDGLARSEWGRGQAALAELVAMAVNGVQGKRAARREAMLLKHNRPRGVQPPPDTDPWQESSEELLRIRGVKPERAGALVKSGYHRLDQLARWSAAEQAWIAELLAVSRRDVGRWVAQAQTILRREQAAREAPPPPPRTPSLFARLLRDRNTQREQESAPGLLAKEVALDPKLRRSKPEAVDL